MLLDKTIDDFLNLRSEIRKEVLPDKSYGFELPRKHFFKIMRCLPSQAYGSRIENYLKDHWYLFRIPRSHKRGDLENIHGLSFEIKVSFKDEGGRYGFIQIRPDHDVAGYICLGIDADNDYLEHYFYVPKNRMLEELEQIGHLAHSGTNLKKIPLLEGSVSYIRWLNSYRILDFEKMQAIVGHPEPLHGVKMAHYLRKYNKQLKSMSING